MEDQPEFSHVDEKNLPTMVDVSEKQPTERMARAVSIVFLGEDIISLLQGQEIYTKKGAVFQTAIIAGVMAVKKTAELIPFCHTLLIESCKIVIETNHQQEAVIECTVKVNAKTGVEMEALTGASVAALTIYDMCKAISSEMCIRETRLIEKTGGKKNYHFKKNP